MEACVTEENLETLDDNLEENSDEETFVKEEEPEEVFVKEGVLEPDDHNSSIQSHEPMVIIKEETFKLEDEADADSEMNSSEGGADKERRYPRRGGSRNKIYDDDETDMILGSLDADTFLNPGELNNENNGMKKPRAKRGHKIKPPKRRKGKTETPCPICDKRFINKTHMREHILAHTGEKPFSCSVCDKRFCKKSNLIRHVQVHKSFQCSYCEQEFNRKARFNEHVRIHTGDKPFVCPTCDTKFTSKNDLIRHQRTHTGEKPFQCSHCDRRFNRKSILTTHTRTHTGERPYECPDCVMKFRSKSDLSRHARTHTGEKPFPCSICERRFNRKSILETHVRTHTGEKPFQCSQCDKRFSDKSNFRGHLRSHADSGAEFVSGLLEELEALPIPSAEPPPISNVEDAIPVAVTATDIELLASSTL